MMELSLSEEEVACGARDKVKCHLQTVESNEMDFGASKFSHH